MSLGEEIKAYVEKKGYPIFSLTVMGEGREPLNLRFCETNRCQDFYSVSKAFVVAAVGLAFDRCLLRVEDKLTDYLGEYLPEGADPRWLDVTLEHCLLHRLGLREGFLDIDVAKPGEFGFDYLQYTFSAEFEADPGTRFLYTDAAFYLLARVVEKATGEPVDALLWRELFYPLGFAEAAWSRCPMGHPMGGTGLYLTTEDACKLGELFRLGGVWQGKRILSEKWVKTVLERGYELCPVGIGSAYAKGGMAGQMLAVFPEYGVSVAWHGFGDYSGIGILRDLSKILKKEGKQR